MIQKGVLRSLLTTRQPVRKAAASNGHARFPAGFGTRAAAIGNLFVKPAESTPLAVSDRVLARMPQGRRLTVLQKQDNWVWTSTNENGVQIDGWVPAENVILFARATSRRERGD